VTRIRWVALVWALAVIGATSMAVGWWLDPFSDPRLNADKSAALLRARLGVDWTFVCTSAENDGTLPADVDYVCQPSRASEIGYWLETDDSSITIVGRTG